MILACLLAIVLAPWFAVLFTIHRLLHLVRPQNRRFHPLVVWVNLVPGLNLLTWPVTVVAFARIVRTEAAVVGLDIGDRFSGLFSAGAMLSTATLIISSGFVTLNDDMIRYTFVGCLCVLGLLSIHCYSLEQCRRALAAAHDGTPPWWEDEGE